MEENKKTEETCEICKGTGQVTIQTAPDDEYTRACECQDNVYTDFSGATDGDR